MEKKRILIIIAIMFFSSIVLASDYIHTNIIVKAEENTRIFLWVYDAPTGKIIRSFNRTISPTGIFDIDLESKPKMMHFKVNVYKDGLLIRQREFKDRQYPPGGKIVLDTLKEEKVENFTVKENSINQEKTEENQVKESEESQRGITGKSISQNNSGINFLFYGILAGFFLILFLGFLIFVGFKFFKKLKSSEKIKVTKLSDKLKEEEEKKKKKEKERLEELEKRLKEIQDEIDRLKNRDKKLEEARKKYEEAKAELERLENLE